MTIGAVPLSGTLSPPRPSLRPRHWQLHFAAARRGPACGGPPGLPVTEWGAAQRHLPLETARLESLCFCRF